jgi:transposase
LRAEAAAARAQRSDDQALIAVKLQIEKLNRDRYGPRSERTAWLLDKLEMTLEELEASVTEDGLAAEMAAAKTTRVASFTRKRPSCKPFPEHLPRERLIVPGPTACACCGGSRLSELLEVIPTKSWKVIQQHPGEVHCRDCEKISQAPAPFHVIARGWAGPSLLAMVLFEKFGQHSPVPGPAAKNDLIITRR